VAAAGVSEAATVAAIDDADRLHGGGDKRQNPGRN
jgi:hypothetical protein